MTLWNFVVAIKIFQFDSDSVLVKCLSIQWNGTWNNDLYNICIYVQWYPFDIGTGLFFGVNWPFFWKHVFCSKFFFLRKVELDNNKMWICLQHENIFWTKKSCAHDFSARLFVTWCRILRIVLTSAFWELHRYDYVPTRAAPKIYWKTHLIRIK